MSEKFLDRLNITHIMARKFKSRQRFGHLILSVYYSFLVASDLAPLE